jgi:predicted nucleic acid-binding protein
MTRESRSTLVVMTDEIDLYYWDACLFYEWLKGTQTDAARRQAIQECLEDNKVRRNRIFTSAITHVEVLPKKVTTQEEQRYWAQFNSVYFFDIEVDRQVLQLARQIKDFYYKEADPENQSGYQMVSTGDAIHVATAIIHNATELWTRDRRPHHGNFPILRMADPVYSPDGKVCGQYDLKISDPQARQGDLLRQDPPLPGGAI